MNVLHAFWLATLIGACLFFVAGFFAARTPRAQAFAGFDADHERALAAERVDPIAATEPGIPPISVSSGDSVGSLASPTSSPPLASGSSMPDDASMQLEAEMNALRAQLEEARAARRKESTEVLALRHTRDHLIRELETARRGASRAAELEASREQLTRDLEAARASVSARPAPSVDAGREQRIARELDAARKNEKRVVELEQSRDHLTRELAEAREGAQRAAELEPLAREHERLVLELAAQKIKSREADSLPATIDELNVRLRDAERLGAEVERLRDVDSARAELAIRNEVLGARVEENERLRDENASLRAALLDSRGLREQVNHLEDALAAASARGMVSGPAPAMRRTTIPPESTERATFAALLERLAHAEGLEAVTLADEMGLPIASRGDYGDTLAAFSGLVVDAASRARHYFPFGAVRRIVVEDEAHTTITTFPYVDEDARLALVSLTVGASPDFEHVRDLLCSSAGLMRRRVA